MGEAVAKEGVLDVRADVGGYAGGMGIHKLRGGRLTRRSRPSLRLRAAGELVAESLDVQCEDRQVGGPFL